MKRIILFLIICLFPSLITFSQQIPETGDFLYLKSGRIVNAPAITAKNPLIGAPYFLVGDKKYVADEVKYARLYPALYANISQYSSGFKPSWARSFSTGKINFYEHYDIFISGTGSFFIRTNYFYSRGLGTLKEGRYKNLVVDLADNSESMKYLHKFKVLTCIEVPAYIVAAGLIIGGVAINASQEENTSKGIPMLLTGVGIYGVTIFGITLGVKPRMLYNAAVSYNR